MYVNNGNGALYIFRNDCYLFCYLSLLLIFVTYLYDFLCKPILVLKESGCSHIMLTSELGTSSRVGYQYDLRKGTGGYFHDRNLDYERNLLY